jgi:hypothetical protein
VLLEVVQLQNNSTQTPFSVVPEKKELTCLDWIKLKRTWMLLISLALVFLALIALIITHFLLVATGEIFKPTLLQIIGTLTYNFHF